MNLERTVLIIPFSNDTIIKYINDLLYKYDYIILDSYSPKLVDSEMNEIKKIINNSNLSAAGAGDKIYVYAVEKINAISELYNLYNDTLLNDSNINNNVYVPKLYEHSTYLLNLLFKKPFVLEQTFAMIKPDAYNNNTEQILQEIKNNGFTILKSKKIQFTNELCEQFYSELKGIVNSETKLPILPPLIEFMTSGPSIALLLSKPAAIRSWRVLIGPTDPKVCKATKPHTLRAKYGSTLPKNAFHGSDKPEAVDRECRLLLPDYELPFSNEVLNQYLDPNSGDKDSFSAVLVSGLAEMCKKKPVGIDAIRFLAEYLEQNNPRKPKVEEPDD